MGRPPSGRQIEFLERLRYTGESPRSVEEASAAITEMVAKKGSESAHAALLRARTRASRAAATEAKRERREELRYVKAEIRQMLRENREMGGRPLYLGYRLLPIDDAPILASDAEYEGAFVPLEVASRFPDLVVRESLEYVEVMDGEKLPRSLPVVIKPGKIKRPRGCVGAFIVDALRLAFVVVAFVVLIIIVARWRGWW